MANIVERLEAEPAHECCVANDHRNTLVVRADIAREGDPLSNGDAGPCVAAVKDVVW